MACRSRLPVFGRYGVPVRYSPEEGQWDLGTLLGAATPDGLHRALVMGPPATVGREPTLPVALLRQVHEAGSEEVAPTLVLLATDPRFSSVTGLAAALVDTGLVPDGVVDLVAVSLQLTRACGGHVPRSGSTTSTR